MHRDRFDSHQTKQPRAAVRWPGSRSFDRRGDDGRERVPAKLQKTYEIREQEALRQIRDLRSRGRDRVSTD